MQTETKVGWTVMAAGAIVLMLYLLLFCGSCVEQQQTTPPAEETSRRARVEDFAKRAAPVCPPGFTTFSSADGKTTCVPIPE